MRPVVRHRREAGHERPYRTIVVVQRLIQRVLRREQARAPVGGHVGRRQAPEHPVGPTRVQRAERHRRGGPHREGIVHPQLRAPCRAAASGRGGALPLQQREGVDAFVVEPELLLQRGIGLLQHSRRRVGQGRLAHVPRHGLHAREGRHPHARQVDVRVQGLPQPAHLDGAGARRRVLHEPVAVPVRGRGPVVRLQDLRPVLSQEGVVAAGQPVAVAGQQPERCRVAVEVGVRVLLEPRQAARGLGDLVRDLAVLPLVAGREAEPLAYQVQLPQSVHGEGVDGRVSAEEPAKAGPMVTGPRRPEPGHQAAAQVRVAHQLLVQVHLGPLQGPVQIGRRRPQGELVVAHAVGVGLPLRDIALRVGEDPVIDGRHRVLRRRTAGRDDGNQLAGRAGRVELEDELGRPRGRVVRRLGRAGHGERRADERVVVVHPALREQERFPLRPPGDVLATEGARPRQVEVRAHAHVHVQRPHRLHVQQDEHAGLVQGHGHPLPHRERGVGVDDGDAFRTHDHSAGDGGTVQRLVVVRNAERQVQVPHQLEGPGPDFQGTALVSEHRRPPAHVAHVEPGAGGTFQLARIGRLREARHPGGRLGRARRGGRESGEDDDGCALERPWHSGLPWHRVRSGQRKLNVPPRASQHPFPRHGPGAIVRRQRPQLTAGPVPETTDP